MNSPRIWRGIALAVLVIGLGIAIGTGAYHAGVEHGLATTGQAVVETQGAWPYAWHHGWHGFFFAPFFFLFFLFFLFLMFRLVFWRRAWGGGCGHRGNGVPPAFEEWHRRAHETPPPGTAAK